LALTVVQADRALVLSMRERFSGLVDQLSLTQLAKLAWRLRDERARFRVTWRDALSMERRQTSALTSSSGREWRIALLADEQRAELLSAIEREVMKRRDKGRSE
jgi:hypothetical protein